MYIRNEVNRAVIQVATEADIDALQISQYAKWLFKCALKALKGIESEPNDALSRGTLCLNLQTQLSENPHVIDCRIVCDDRNNPPSALDVGPIVTVFLLLDAGFGELIYSFANKEL